jgi:hypothetical protein
MIALKLAPPGAAPEEGPLNRAKMSPPDDELIERCLQDDGAAWEGLVARYRRKVFHIGCSQARPRGIRRRSSQDSRASTSSTGRRFSTWLSSVARTTVSTTTAPASASGKSGRRPAGLDQARLHGQPLRAPRIVMAGACLPGLDMPPDKLREWQSAPAPTQLPEIADRSACLGYVKSESTGPEELARRCSVRRSHPAGRLPNGARLSTGR